jgi:putative DNA primase/helicase
MSGDILRQFADALRARDILPPSNIIADGRLRRCDAKGRRGKGDAAYLLHLDGFPAGGFENWRDGRGWETWHADIDRQLSKAERDEHKRRMAKARAQRDADDRQRRTDAAARAEAIWCSAATECNGFPYLEKKHIGPNGARLWHEKLVVPARDLDSAVHSLQFIDQSGGKRFLTDGRTRSGFCPIGELVEGGVILIAEGFAPWLQRDRTFSTKTPPIPLCDRVLHVIFTTLSHLVNIHSLPNF